MSKIRVVLSGLYFPVAILRYFEKAFRNHPDVELITVGVGTGTWIPWNSGMDLPEKYATLPNISFPKHLWNVGRMPANGLYTNPLLQDIDLWVQCDAGFSFSSRPPARVVAHIATDPHVLPYDGVRQLTDYFFNMQSFYSSPGDLVFPYAASKYDHYPMPELQASPTADVAIIGLNYPVRNSLANRLRRMGITVHHTLGLGMDEYREANNSAKVMVSWSSKNDLIARVFEAGAMKVPLVTNYVPALQKHFEDNVDMLMFFDENRAVELISSILENPSFGKSLAENMHEKVKASHYYDHRVDFILEKTGMYG